MGVTSKCVGDGERRHGKGQTKGEGGDAAAPGPGPSWAGPGRAAPRDLPAERGRRQPAGGAASGPGEAALARQLWRSPRRSRPPPSHRFRELSSYRLLVVSNVYVQISDQRAEEICARSIILTS